MGRLRRLKERHDKIKVTACSLALSLVIGSTQGLGTYALFTDTEDVASNLAISTGDVDVELEEGFKGDITVEDTNGKAKTFNIYNKGTLRQKLQLQLTLPEGINIDETVLDNIQYKLNIEGMETKVFKFSEIKIGKVVDLEYSNGDKIILSPGDIITCTSTVSVINPNTSSGGQWNIDFNLKVLASQVADRDSSNYNEHIGFTDLYNQNNSITVKYGLLTNESPDLGTCGFTPQYLKGSLNEMYIPIDIPSQNRTAISVSGTGVFENSVFCMTTPTTLDIRTKDFKPYNIPNQFTEADTITVKAEYRIDRYKKEVKTWVIKLRHVNSKLEVYYTVTSEIKNKIGELENVEDTYEEVESSSELYIENQSKEEFKVQEDLGVIEEPNVEEGVLPSQADIVIERKEETEIEE